MWRVAVSIMIIILIFIALELFGVVDTGLVETETGW